MQKDDKDQALLTAALLKRLEASAKFEEDGNMIGQAAWASRASMTKLGFEIVIERL